METIKQQFENMLNKGIIPVFEFELPDNDWLVVYIKYDDKENRIEFSFDSNNKPVYFDGEIIVYSDNYYAYQITEYDNSLDSILEFINDNITEGYLIPNNLYI